MVIVIVGMLAAMLFPVLARARGAAEKTSCLNNLKELILATQIYEQDYDDQLFPFGYAQGDSYITWWGDLNTGDASKSFLYPYTKSGQIRGCPSAADLPNVPPYTYTMGYGMNFRLFYCYPPEDGPTGYRTISATQVERPSETLFSADSATWDATREEAVTSAWLFGDSWSSHLQSRHSGDVANVAWLDGHATARHLYFQITTLGVPPNTVDAKTLKANNLGDLLKFPREDPYAPINSERDQFYFLLQKPKGT